jgi:hypothetical protein
MHLFILLAIAHANLQPCKVCGEASYWWEGPWGGEWFHTSDDFPAWVK